MSEEPKRLLPTKTCSVANFRVHTDVEKLYVRFLVLTQASMKKAVFLDITQFSLVAVYTHRPENEGRKHLLNVGKHLPGTRRNVAEEIFLPAATCRLGLSLTRTPVHWYDRLFYLRVKRPKHEAGHSPPSSAEVKMRVVL
jgi:hypothetical protein